MAYTTNAALTAFPSAYSRTRTSTGVHQLGERAGTHWPFSPLVIPSKKLPGELAQVRRKAILRPKLKILVAKVITNRHLADHPILQDLVLVLSRCGLWNLTLRGLTVEHIGNAMTSWLAVRRPDHARAGVLLH